MSFLELLQISLPVFLVLAAGAGLRKTGLLPSRLDEAFLRLTLYVLYPCLVLDLLVGNEALRQPENLYLPPLCGFFVVLLGYGVSWVAGRLAGLETGKNLRTFSFTCGIQNYGYIALPITLFLFGGDAAAVLIGFSLGVEFAFWGAGVALLRGTAGIAPGFLLSPPILSVLAGIGLNLAGAENAIPVWVDRAIEMLGACAVPLALLLTGALFADYAKREYFLRQRRILVLSILVRLGVLPVLILGFAAVFPLDSALKQVLLVQASMSAAVAPMAVTRLFGGDMSVACKVILGTTIAGLFTIPFWLFWGLKWLGFD